MTIPNCITVARMVITLALYPLVFLGLREWFLAGFVAAFASDVLDGYLARRWNQTSYLGMRLDSFADYLFIASSLIWAWRLAPALFREHPAAWMAMTAALAVPQIIGLVKLGRNAGFHLYSTKAAGWIAFFLFLHALVSGRYSGQLLRLLVVAVFVKSAEETWICLRVPDPYADPRPSALAYLRRGRQV